MMQPTRFEAIVLLTALLLGSAALAGRSPATLPATSAGDMEAAAGSILIGTTSPRNGETIGTATPTILVPYGDTNLGATIVAVSFLLDGMNLTSAGTFNQSVFVLPLALELRNGPHLAAFAVADNAGGSGSASWTFTVDTLPPILLVTEPVYPAVPSTAVYVNGTAVLADATLFAGAAPINVTATVLPQGATVWTYPAADGSFSLFVPLAEGVNIMFVNATDRLGNFATTIKSIVSDTTPPALVIDTPDTPVSASSTVWVSGHTEPGAYVVVDGYSVAVSPLDGSWGVNLTLPDGINIIKVAAADPVGNLNYTGVGILVDSDAPRIVLTSPTVFLTNRNQVLVSGTVTDTMLYALQVNLNPVLVAANGAFSTTVNLAEGLNPIVLVAVDAAQHVTTLQLAVRLDTTPPVVTVALPPDGLETNTSTVAVQGTVDDGNATLLVNGQAILPDASRHWRTTVALLPGGNTILVSAVDVAGNRAPPVALHVTYFSPIPDLENGTSSAAQSVEQLGAVLRFSLVGLVLLFVAITFILYSRTARRIRQDRRVIAELVRRSRRKP